MTEPLSKPMPTLFLMCGLPGAGKTTRAREIEKEHAAIRLTPDEWIAAMGLDPYDEPLRARIEALQWQMAERALRLGLDAILDWGLWARSERDDFRARAHALGVEAVVVFLDVPHEELWRRLERRNVELPPGTFPIPESEFREYVRIFQPPYGEAV
ncbi:MAG: AAA family ATPase [Fimbriimonas sp.]